MKKFLSIIAVATVSLLAASSLLKADDEGWTTDYKQALAQAKSQNKLVMLDFTGSDWCGWCMKLNKEVFSQPKFKEYAQ